MKTLFFIMLAACGISCSCGQNEKATNSDLFTIKEVIDIDIYKQTTKLYDFCPTKDRKKFSAPDFGGGENLSFEGCGIWTSDPTTENDRPSWFIVTKMKDSDEFCWGVLISGRSVILTYCEYSENLNNFGEMQVFGGESCSNHEDGCFYNKRLLQELKVINVTPLRSHSLKEKMWYMFTSKLNLNERNLMPICLYNRDNSDDLSNSNSYYGFNTKLIKGKLPEQGNCCVRSNDVTFNDSMPYWRAHFDEQICTSLWSQRVLINGRKEQNGATRYFLRGLISFIINSDYNHFGSFADVNAWLREVVSLAPDLALMPHIPPPKTPIQFKTGLSYPDCGKVQIAQNIARRRTRSTDDQRPTGLVFGGVNDQKGATPWHVSINVHGKRGIYTDACGGTLISNTAILTAAHCLNEKVRGNLLLLSPSQVELTFGKYDSSKSNHMEPFRQSYFTKEVLIHPEYNQSAENFENDIALLIIEPKVLTFNEMVQPACLWAEKDNDIEKIAGSQGEVAGWGLTAENKRSAVLQKAYLDIVTHRTCFSNNKNFFGKYLKPTLNFCAGIPNQATTCVGDSGGGLTIYNNGRHYLRGITSFAPDKRENVDGNTIFVCSKKYYSVFADVTNYMDWIVKNAFGRNPKNNP
ncbi:enteropeptidase-like [Neocloeon triangulifer]|uniref:enteropeptidase-like n=1 Tax=Neocloeon triangulifer TaxID=2078957 RepID=UPI00286FA048|nr:enteropeptidase-like [Neocloeon triangulifer]